MANDWPTYKPIASGIKPPENYEETPLFDPFEAELGPFFRKTSDDTAENASKNLDLALFLDERHRDSAGLAAVGALMAIADATMGWSGFFLMGPDNPAVTVRLNNDFVQRPKVGAYLYCRTSLDEVLGDTMLISGQYHDNAGKLVMRATSVWKMIAVP